MNVLAREDRRLDAIARAARLDEAHRRLDRLLHHFAELAGGLDLALARNGYRFDREQLAADFGPGEPGDGANLVLLLADAVAEAADAKELTEIIERELDLFDLVLEDLPKRLAGDLGQLALKRPDPGLAGVVPEHSLQGLVGKHELARLEAVRLHLLGDQVAFGDLNLLFLGVTLEPDDLHPVHQRLRHVERVGGGDEHHVAEVVIELEIMVLEAVVLLGIEHFQQRRGRIAAEVLAELVDLVEQEQRVRCPRLLDVGNDLARQRADVGPAVAADLGLVAHAAQ